MQKRLQRFFGMMVLLLLGSIFLLPQSTFSQSELPEAIAFPAYDTLLPNQLIPEVFYPVGFSPSGHFAYCVEPADEACGCYFFTFRIQNLVTDEVVWEYKYNSDRSKLENPPENLAELWKVKGDEFRKKMQEYGIKRQKTELQGLPIRTGQGTISVVQNQDFEFNRFGMKDTFIVASRVQARHASGAAKQIARLHYPNYSVMELKPVGYLRSPFEERVALLMVRKERGWEGPPHITRFEVIGIHLWHRF